MGRAATRKVDRAWTTARLWGGLRKYGSRALVDCLAVAVTYAAAVLIRVEGRLEELDEPGLEGTLLVLAAAGAAQVISNMLFAVYWRDWSVGALEDVAQIAKSTVLVAFGLLVLNALTPIHYVPTGAVLAGASLVFVVETVLNLRPRWPHLARALRGPKAAEGIIVVGAGRVAQLFAADMLSRETGYSIYCYVDDDRKKHGSYLRGIRIAGGIDALPELIEKYRPSLVVIAIAHAPGTLIRRVVKLCEDRDVLVRKLTDLGLRRGDTSSLREIGIEELLVRDPVALDTPEARDYLRGRVVLVTGAAGSIGSELCRQILRFEPARLILVDLNESGLDGLQKQLGSGEIALVDVRDRQHLTYLFERSRPEIVFHAAAYKHVPILERAPLAALAANISGTANALACCAAANVLSFVFISTDKAVEPTSVLGYTKRFGEILTVAAARDLARNYSVVRFGNVLESSGSAVPTFARQIDNGGPVTITHPDATRYFMTIPEAAGLVIEAGAIAEPGDVLVLDMGLPINVQQLVRRMISLRGLRTPADIDIRIVGLRPGEKLHEKLFFSDEKPLATRHPRVQRVQQAANVPSLALLQAAVREIERCVSCQESDEGLAITRRVVENPLVREIPDAETRVVNFPRV